MFSTARLMSGVACLGVSAAFASSAPFLLPVNITADVDTMAVYIDDNGSPYGGDIGPAGYLDANGQITLKLALGQHKITFAKMLNSHTYLVKNFDFMVTSEQDINKTFALRINENAACDFAITGIAKVHSYNMGWYRYVLHTEIASNTLGVEYPQAVGQWIKYQDTATGAVFQQTIKGTNIPFVDGRKVVSLNFEFAGRDMPPYFGASDNKFDFKILEMAYFADISTNIGGFVTLKRVWLSNNGNNFSLNQIMQEPTYAVSSGNTSVTWANQNSSLFTTKQRCGY